MATVEPSFTSEHAMKLMTIVRLSLITLVASFSRTGQAQTFSVIHAFTGQNGAAPEAGVTIRAGTLYGTTRCVRYCTGAGTLYQITHVGSNWIHTPILFFSGQDGSAPENRVVFGPDSQLYGATNRGGPQGGGLVFNLTLPVSICKTANCFGTEEVLHLFTGSPDGNGPGTGDLVWDPMGNIYGTTVFGGTSNLGTVYQMTKSGNSWTEAPIYSFTGPDGKYPDAGVILDSNGSLFGTASQGGVYGYGTVFELNYSNGIGWTQTVLYNFQNLSDGQAPYAGLIGDSGGNLYGTTRDGGSGGGGTVFELSHSGATWTFSLLYSLPGMPGYKNCGPAATLAMDAAGNLYGTTLCDGAQDLGNVFKLTNTQNLWEYTSLYDFGDGDDGGKPVSNVTFDTDGNLYGTASVGGVFNGDCPLGCGVVWMIKP
jgi:uncharacterized repeat protein (TIGR03803 family)